MDAEVFLALRGAIDDQQPAVLATVTRTWGSTPRTVGAKMVVFPDGTSLGTVGGGCGEAEVRRNAMIALDTGKPLLISVDLTGDFEVRGEICGGVMEVFIDPILYRKSSS